MDDMQRKAVLARIAAGELSASEGVALLRAVGPGLPSELTAQVAQPSAEPGPRQDAGVDPVAAVQDRLAAIIAQVAQIPLETVTAGEPLEQYGFDSVMALDVVRSLEPVFGLLSPTLLFEHQNVGSLAAYLVASHPEPAQGLASTAASSAPVDLPEDGHATVQPAPSASPALGRPDMPIAIVGLSCRVPGAGELDRFWENLKSGRDCITEIPEERWNQDEFFDPVPGRPGKSYTRWGGFLDDAEAFDAEFFRVSPREAERMDPQERLVLEEVWHALEDGGLTRKRIGGKAVGVYIGVMYSQYQLLQAQESLRGNPLHLGSSYASIANRVSYFFDLRGPSMALDTMCSSSLTAIHLACEALRRGDIEVAVTGGVNLSVHPAKFVDLSQGRYASTDGRCRSFGAGGDGYVPGEGVGVAVLKPLAAAEADGDRIHAVIRGSAIGHGGKTNGYSVPNPLEQSRLITEALRRSGTDPADVSYVEAHGTGTSLGDPIEVTALDRALGERGPAGPCAIGSVKSNIGHLEAAAGMAGLAKIVLQMRHRQLAPSLHAEELNPHIDFERTGLRVQRTLQPWEPAGGVRIAGLSSFGAGGANAHVVVEEYQPPRPTPIARRPELIVLSAQTEERLRTLAGSLAAHLAGWGDVNGDEPARLAGIGHTLRNGREALDERLAFIVSSHAELVQTLREFAHSGTAAGVLRGHRRPSAPKDASAPARPPADQEDLADLAELAELARRWVVSDDVDLATLTAHDAVRPLALPGYPFLRERHWPHISAAVPGAGALHPLLDRNTSVFGGQRFTLALSGDSRWVSEHQVDGRPVLPAAALAEMVLAAAQHSGMAGPVQLIGTVWSAPVEIAAHVTTELTVELSQQDGQLAYTVSSPAAVHARGRVRTRPEPEAPPERIDLQALVQELSPAVDGSAWYREFESRGLQYGPLLQVLDRIHPGNGRALARVRATGGSGSNQFRFPPALLDGAFQSLVGAIGDDAGTPTRIPFSADLIVVDGVVPSECWVYVQARAAAADAAAQVFDLLLATDAGHVVARVEGLVVRPAAAAQLTSVVLESVWRPAPLPRAAAPLAGTLLVFEADEPLSLPRDVAARTVRVHAGAQFGRRAHDVFVIDPNVDEHYQLLLEQVSPDGPPIEAVVHAWSLASPASDEVTVSALSRGISSVRALATALLAGRPVPAVRLLYLHLDGAPVHTAVAAFGRALAAENPALVLSTLAVPTPIPGTGRGWIDEVRRELAEPAAGAQVRDEGDVRLVKHLTEARPAATPGPTTTIRERGVYVLTGALGGLGRVLARDLATHHQARLVLTGRSEPGEAGEALLTELRELGGQAVYLAADCADADGARSVVREARTRFGRIDGIIHLAGVLRDGLVSRSRRSDSEAVLHPKVWGAHQLDAATADDDLDFFALFSSASSVVGIAGQSDYAYANAFLDAFAERRAHLQRQGRRSGASVSISWPLWDEGGMDIDAAAKQRIERTLGWVPLPVSQGLALFEESLAAGAPHRVVFYGHRERILAAMSTTTLAPAQPAAPVSAGAGPATVITSGPAASVTADTSQAGYLADELRAFLARAMAVELKLPANRFDVSKRFDLLGVESVMVMNLTVALEDLFGDLPRTLFYEYQSVNELTRHLLETYPAVVAARFGLAAGDAAARPTAIERPVAPGPATPPPAPVAGAIASRELSDRDDRDDRDDPIAIVGLSGRYPMADTLPEFWANLRDGRDCITEIPEERWSHDRYFNPDRSVLGTSYSKWGGFLRDVDRFDPLFFAISPREARLMDPQERLFLQTAWHALEDAGHSRSSLAGQRVGVFAGVMYAQYQLYGADSAAQAAGFLPSSLSAFVANRVSYVLGLTGPSLAVDTMCSSSLTALHLACSSIRLGECDQAIAGGVNAILHPNRYLQLSQARFASSDGRCRSFGEGGDGYVPAEGVGAVLLKRLSQAEADGDHIYAVIRGSALNHGGRSNGFTVPTPTAQREVIETALRSAGVKPSEIDYLEAHGTGTALGDPIEIDGLARAFASGPDPAVRCPIGSVKSNIGHAEAAAGMAGLTKILLQMQHDTLVPSLHAATSNQHIRFEDGVFEVQRTLEPWPARTAAGRELPRIAALSSFGAGGSNAHVVVQQYRQEAPVVAEVIEPGPELIVLSARTSEQLRRVVTDLADHLELPTTGALPAAGDDDGLDRELRSVAAEILGVPVQELGSQDDLVDLGFDAVSFTALGEYLLRAHALDAGPALAQCSTLQAVRALLPAAVGVAADDAAGGSPTSLRDIAFTLRTGREPLDERLAFIARDVVDLRAKLREFCRDDEAAGMFRGRPDSASGLWNTVLEGSDGEDFLAAIRRSGALGRLAALWVSGVTAAGSGERAPGARRVTLPGYPFARERFWVPQTADPAIPAEPAPAAPPAPFAPAAPPAPFAPAAPPAPVADAEIPPTEMPFVTMPSPAVAPVPMPPMPPVTMPPAAMPPVATPPVLTPLPSVPAATAESTFEFARRSIVATMAEVLEIDTTEFALDVPHSDFGVDSVLAVEIVDRINLELGAELKPTDFFSYATVRKIAEHVVSEGVVVPVRAAAATVPAGAGASPAPPPGPTAPPPAPARSPDAEVRSPAAEVRSPDAEVRSPDTNPAGWPGASSPGTPGSRPASSVTSNDVAVIGMSGRFPDARNLDELWENLKAGHGSVREIPASRWDVGQFWDADRQAPGKTYSKWGSVLADAAEFDPAFFGLSPREARLMDPQQRLYLMEAWRALEDAGYADRSLDGAECQAFAGTATGDYHHLLRENGVPLEGYTFMGTHPAVLASRLSFHLNLRGPSIAVDTSCSSSLMAIHLACEAIREGRCEVALAGGVAALFTPELHILTSKAGMLSPTGQCRSFDDAADGFVPGEGVAVLVLKGLQQALADGDHIHGVIAGTGANQDGRTNGITAPSGPAQTELEASVYRRFGIDPEGIGYVECHGTGTRLGDPIEIEALSAAFRQFTDRSGFCAVGSIKSNLGHTLTAAGVAGVIKALLCLRHGQLVPSLHHERTNRYIDFAASPFFVNTELRDWTIEPGTERMAAVSSFGFSGTNVHAVIRQAPLAPPRPAEVPAVPRLCPVSAKTEIGLQRRLADLATWLATEASDHEWRDIAYTLGAGRSHFTERAAFIATGAEDLRRQIEARRAGTVAPLTAAGPLTAHLGAYLAGADIDWLTVHGDGPHRRLAMPTYPFARDSYWVPRPQVDLSSGSGTAGRAVTATVQAPLAPSVPAAAPGRVEERVFEHLLSDTEPMVADHVVDGQPLLPAAGHLSLVHHDLTQMFGDVPLTLTRAVWLRPLFVLGQRRIEIVVRPGDHPGQFSVEVRAQEENETVVFSRAQARVGGDEVPVADLDRIGERCDLLTSAGDHYARFDASGVRYGPHFRTVRWVRSGPGEVLALLEHAGGGPDLPAGVLDGAVQSVVALQADTAGRRPLVPFAMDEIHLLRPVPAVSMAHIRHTRAGECDLSLLDADGRACVVVTGFSYRELKEPVRTRLYVPQWRAVPAADTYELSDPAGRQPARPTPASVLIVVPPQESELASQLARRHHDAQVRILRLRPGQDAGAVAADIGGHPLPERVYFLGALDRSEPEASLIQALARSQELGVTSLFRVVKALIAAGAGSTSLDLISVTAGVHAVTGQEPLRPYAAGVFGLTRSLAKEYPGWRVGCVDADPAAVLDPGAEQDNLVSLIAAHPGHPDGDETVVREGRHWQRRFHVFTDPVPETTPFRRRGTYLILGGAGGIGSELALHLARRAAATVVLLGRRPQNAEIDGKLRAIEAEGGTGAYYQVDATDEAAMDSVVSAVRDRFGPIHGAVHSALTLLDSRIEGMDEAAFEAALAPKVQGSVVLAHALRREPLDFLLFFSSAQSFSGNAGQANYSAACTFKDAFAAALAASGVPAYIVNWGYWGEVGVVAKAVYRRRMQAAGVYSVEPAEGMAALEIMLAGRIAQAMPLKAEQRVLQRFGIHELEAGPAAPAGESGWNPLSGRHPAAPPDSAGLVQAHAALSSLAELLVIRALQELGAFTVAGEQRAAERLVDELGVVSAHRQLWATLIRMVTDAGLLRRVGDVLVATKAAGAVTTRDLVAEGHRIALAHPMVAAHIELLLVCMPDYPRVLRGEIDPTTVLFPNSSMERLDGIYRGNPLSDRINELAAHAVLAGVTGGAQHRPIRVLEIGAGTGGTSGPILQALDVAGQQVEYVYTDISAGFLRHGRRTFAPGRPYLDFAVLDIESDPLEQGFEAGSVDIVVAANVLHATRDLRATLAHVGELLRPDGRLVLAEATAFSPFTTLVFGMLPGWWLAQDGALRITGAPLATAATWQGLLGEVGFDRTAAVPAAPGIGEALGLHVVVGQRTAIIPAAVPAGPATSPARRAEVEVMLGAVIAETLGYADLAINPQRAFVELGVSSVGLVELVSAVNARLGLELRTTAMFDYPTLSDLTDFVCAELAAGPETPTRPEPLARDSAGSELEMLRQLAAGELTADQIYARLEQS